MRPFERAWRIAVAACLPLCFTAVSARAVIRNDLTAGNPPAFPAAVQFGNFASFNASATVIGGGQYVITAAHAITIGNDGSNYRVQTQDGAIVSGTGTVAIDPNANSDLAIVQLASPLPNWADLYTSSDEIGKTVVFTGFGVSSTTAGDGSSNIPYGTPRQGSNRISSIVSGNELRFDFDLTGTSSDANGDGLGASEGTTFGGDSGMGWLVQVGSSFKILGIHDGILSNPGLNRDQTISYATRVSTEASWILSNVPEPSVLGPGFISVIGLLKRSRRC